MHDDTLSAPDSSENIEMAESRKATALDSLCDAAIAAASNSQPDGEDVK
jgi:hypothetical protein